MAELKREYRPIFLLIGISRVIVQASILMKPSSSSKYTNVQHRGFKLIFAFGLAKVPPQEDYVTAGHIIYTRHSTIIQKPELAACGMDKDHCQSKHLVQCHNANHSNPSQSGNALSFRKLAIRSLALDFRQLQPFFARTMPLVIISLIDPLPSKLLSSLYSIYPRV